MSFLARFLARAACLGALILAVAGLAPVAAAKTILVIAPHSDDEVLVAGGTWQAAVAARHTVKIVVVLNGDSSGGVEEAQRRQGESVAAAQRLGLTENDVIFLGYGTDSLMEIYNAASPDQVITSRAGQTQTYGTRGRGGMDFHRHKFGSPGPYNRATVEQDMRAVLEEFRPDEVYTVSNFDTHPDHHAVALFVTDALIALKRSGAALSTKLYQGIVWPPTGAGDNWPEGTAPTPAGCDPERPFPPLPQPTQLEWKRTMRAVVLANLKCQAIHDYTSQATLKVLSFARKDEFFWVSDFGANLAITAQVTVSSENSAANQGRLKAVDGVTDGTPHDPTREWASASQSGAWIQLAWPAPVSVAQVNLHDRPHGGENVLAGTLTFSDGTSIAVGELPPDGKLLPVTFAPKTVSWVRFTIDQAQGTAAGLSEIQVLGAATQVAPHFLEGPGGNSDKAILTTETATFFVQAHDLNGDPLQYEWSADGGTINGSGANAVFTPPGVTETTVFTITARILDGRGGSASNVGFVTVTAAVEALKVSPTGVVGGDSAQGTVTLANPAPAGGLSVPLSSSNASAAQVPASITVPAGASNASFPVNTSPVGARTEVTLSANIRGTVRSATLAVTPRPGSLPSGNLLLSPDSIGEPPNWMIFGTTLSATLNYAAAPDGTQNASRALATQPGGHGLTQQVAVAENTSYTFSFWARNNGGTAAAYSVHCESLGTDIIAPTPYISGINGAGWTQVSATFTTPAGCTSILVYPVRDSGGPVDVLVWRATLVRSGGTTPPALASLAVSPQTVTGGGSATGTVTLTAAAPAGGAQVTLSSNNAAASVPASVTVPAGATSANFTVSTAAVSTPTAVTISGAYGGATQTAALTVTPAVISSLVMSPASVAGGTPASGTVTLSGPAPAGGAQVALSSNNAAVVVPPSVTVAAGAASASFNAATTPVAAPTTVTISGSYGGATQSGTVTVTPPRVASLSLSASSVTGGTSVTGTVTLDGPAPAGGAQVALSDNSAATSVPASVTVAGGGTSATFTVTTSPVAASTSSSISASYGGGTQSVTLTVLPPALPIVSSLGVNPASVMGGTSVTGTVTLSGPAPAGGAQVALSDNSGVTSVPSTVTVPAGATSVSFSIGTSAVAASTSVTISASYGGATRTASLTVLPLPLPSVSALNVSLASVTGGTSVTGTVTLTAPAPAGGAQVALSDNNAAASLPASVTVPAGATSASFNIATSAVANNTAVTLSASYGGATRTATLTVLHAVLTSLDVNPSSVLGLLGSATGTLTLNGPAPAGGAVVTVSDNSGACSAPGSVTIPAGATSATFTVRTGLVLVTTTCTITGTYKGTSRSDTLRVTL